MTAPKSKPWPRKKSRTYAKSAKGRTVSQYPGATRFGSTVPQSVSDFFKDVRKPFIRSSELEALDACPRKFLLQNRLGVRSRNYSSPLTTGSILHKVLQCLFLGMSEADALAAGNTLAGQEAKKLTESANPAGFLPEGKDLGSVLQKLGEDSLKAQAMALVFWRANPFDTSEWDVLQTPDGVPMVELLMQMKIPGLSRELRCPCDLALVKKGTNEVWIVDFKTTSFTPKIRAIATKFAVQLKLYRLALVATLKRWAEENESYPDYKVAGSYHAIIKKPGIKFCKKDKDFNAYVERLVGWYIDAEEKAPEDPPMVLDPNRFSGDPLPEELRLRLLQYCSACNAPPDVDAFYRAGGGVCFAYNSPCPYVVLCNSDPVNWPGIIEESFKIEFREDTEEGDPHA